MSAAAEKPSEYLKRTCLVCGCNTNQTINIYEPRRGPNIVELIQAKFKFQPLIEDKYLCFSCNNWLINWHSLQANNSNDAESPSGTFRSAQVNDGIAQEKRVENIPKKNKGYDQQKQRIIATCRPIAQVRPQQLLIGAVQDALKTSQTQNPNLTIISKIHAKHYYAKRNFSSSYLLRLRKAGSKQLHACHVCGRTIVLCTRKRSTNSFQKIRKPKHLICRKCRSVYMRSLQHSKLPKITAKASKNSSTTRKPQSLVSKQSNFITQENAYQFNEQKTQCLKQPLVDGKVVAMLRRLGTTLSRECPTNQFSQQLPPIMSPTKPKPRWTRPLEADEILLNFETAISEVLPIVANGVSLLRETATTKAQRKLMYHISCEPASEV